MMRGAEAVLQTGTFLHRRVVIKERRPKRYRVQPLDILLRKGRTRQEARLLHKAKLAGVPCPVVLAVDDFSITMTKIGGKRPESNPSIYRTAGEYLARLHSANIIHGDYTPANLLVVRYASCVMRSGRYGTQNPKRKTQNLYVIDFGLGFFSSDIEDKAIDVLTMLKAIDEKCGKAFLQGYKKYEKYAQVIQRIEQVKGRVRYA